MSSKREQILSALHTKLKTLETAKLKVYRNLDKPQKVVEDGVIILRDGESAEPEVLLSPLTYIYEHFVSLEVMVQHPDQAMRDSVVDALLGSIGGIITSNRSLDGLAEWMEARSPDFNDEPIEGAPTIRAATLQVMIRFFTADPLN